MASAPVFSYGAPASEILSRDRARQKSALERNLDFIAKKDAALHGHEGGGDEWVLPTSSGSSAVKAQKNGGGGGGFSTAGLGSKGASKGAKPIVSASENTSCYVTKSSVQRGDLFRS